MKSERMEPIRGALDALLSFAHDSAKGAGRTLCAVGMTLLMMMQLVPAVSGAEAVASQITAMPQGTKIEVHLKNKQIFSGTRGPVSETGFTLVDSRAGEHELTFVDVVSVKRINTQSHVKRNVLIGVGIGAVVVVGVIAAVVLQGAKTRGL